MGDCPRMSTPPPEQPKNPHAVALGRLGGLAKSERKTEAVRANAKKPRRKRKQAQ